MRAILGYHRAQRGPELERPFTVMTGIAVVVGEETVTLPAGATWPGLDALPKEVIDRLRPAECFITPEAHLLNATRPTPREIEFGVALVTAQMLRSGDLEARVHLLETLGITSQFNQGVLGNIVGTTRETITQLRQRQRRTAGGNNAAD